MALIWTVEAGGFDVPLPREASSRKRHMIFRQFKKRLNIMDDEQMVRALAALAQTHRLKAFRALVVAGPDGITPGLLSERLGVSPAGMSFHLKELVQAGLVTQTRDGRSQIYRAEFERMNAVLHFLSANCCQGQPCELEPNSCQL